MYIINDPVRSDFWDGLWISSRVPPPSPHSIRSCPMLWTGFPQIWFLLCGRITTPSHLPTFLFILYLFVTKVVWGTRKTETSWSSSNLSPLPNWETHRSLDKGLHPSWSGPAHLRNRDISGAPARRVTTAPVPWACETSRSLVSAPSVAGLAHPGWGAVFTTGWNGGWKSSSVLVLEYFSLMLDI